MRDALSLLDSCLSYTDGTVTLQLARDVLGTAGMSFMFDFADALIAFDAGAALRPAGRRAGARRRPAGVRPRRHRPHARPAAGGDRGDVAQLLEITPEDGARFAEQSQRMGAERAARLMDLFMRAEPDMKWASQPRVALELAVVRACHPERAEEDASLAERIARVEQLLASGSLRAAAHPPRRPPRSPLPRPNLRPQSPRPSPARPGSSRRRNTSTPSPTSSSAPTAGASTRRCSSPAARTAR